MELDSKQKVLLALYSIYQKDLPDFDRITPEALGLSRDNFNIAVKKLQDEELIEDVHLIWGEKNTIPIGTVLDLVKITRYGISYIEEIFTIKSNLNGKKKLDIIFETYQKLEDKVFLAWLTELKVSFQQPK